MKRGNIYAQENSRKQPEMRCFTAVKDCLRCVVSVSQILAPTEN